MLLILEVLLTVSAWRKGWGPKALLFRWRSASRPGSVRHHQRSFARTRLCVRCADHDRPDRDEREWAQSAAGRTIGASACRRSHSPERSVVPLQVPNAQKPSPKDSASARLASASRRALSPGLFSELVARLQLAPIHSCMFALATGATRAVRPAQKQVGAQRKHHGGAIQLCLDARSFGRGRHREVQRLPEDHRKRFAHIRIDGGAEYLGLHEKGGRIGPGPARYAVITSSTLAGSLLGSMRQREGIHRFGDARGSHIAIFMVRTGIHSDGTRCRLPQSIRRARRLPGCTGRCHWFTTWNVLTVALAMFVSSLGIYRVTDADVGPLDRRILLGGPLQCLVREWVSAPLQCISFAWSNGFPNATPRRTNRNRDA